MSHSATEIESAATEHLPTRRRTLTKFRDALPRLPVLRPAHADDGQPTLRISLRRSLVRLHSELPTTLMWTFEGSFPGPVIDVADHEEIRVVWHNDLHGPFPVTGVRTGHPVAAPGRQGAPPDMATSNRPAHAILRLGPSSSRTAIEPGQTQIATFVPERQSHGNNPGWYGAQDPLDAVAGLVGLSLLPPETGDDAVFPAQERDLALVLCDRNLDLDPDGYLTGRLLHTVDAASGTEVPGPFTVVNGVIWPTVEVDPAAYRLRLLNASAAVEFELELRGEVTFSQQLALRPRAGADVVVDFSAAAGRTVTLVSTSGSPGREPEVMQFRVGQRTP